MSSPCLSGRAYGLELEMVKPPSSSSSTTTTTIRTSHPSSSSSSSSTTSTLSVEAASNSPLAISTRKPRTPRKRPNQTYHEAAAILSSAYPNIFSGLHNHTSYNSIRSYKNNNNISNNNNNNISSNYPRKFIKPDHHQTNILLVDDPSDLLLPFRVFDNSGFLLHQPIVREKAASFFSEPKLMTNFTSPHHKSCQNNGGFGMGLSEEDDLDAESILDEEVEEGIDSIMGNLTVTNNGDSSSSSSSSSPSPSSSSSCWFNGYPMGLNFGMMKGIKAMRHVDDGNRWSFPVVDVLQISPRLNNSDTHKGSCPVPDSKAQNSNSTKVKLKLRSRDSLSEKKKSKTTAEKRPAAEAASEQQMKDSEKVKEKENGGSVANTNSNSSTTTSSTAGLLLKLNYDDVLNAWSDRESPFSDEIEGSDVSVRLAQIDLWGESGGGVREASVLRYKEKRRNRLFSKKIRYQIRKLNADRRPRMQGRFVRRPNAISTSKQR